MHQRRAVGGADEKADDGADGGHHDRLPAHHRLRLLTAHADGAQQAQLTRAFQHGQLEGVGDADDGHEHGEAEQGQDDAQHLVELADLLLLELLLRLELCRRVVRKRLLPRLLERRVVLAIGLHVDELVEVCVRVGLKRLDGGEVVRVGQTFGL